jgi:hypothetical protein
MVTSWRGTCTQLKKIWTSSTTTLRHARLHTRRAVMRKVVQWSCGWYCGYWHSYIRTSVSMGVVWPPSQELTRRISSKILPPLSFFLFLSPSSSWRLLSYKFWTRSQSKFLTLILCLVTSSRHEARRASDYWSHGPRSPSTGMAFLGEYRIYLFLSD